MVTRQENSRVIAVGLLIVGLLLTAGVIFASCSLQQPTDPRAQIKAAVAATLASIPTYTPYPLPTPFPSPIPVSLDGMFCEYGFCIGHPMDVYLIDEGSTHRPPVASAQTNGILFGYNQSLFMQVIWRVSDPKFDPQSAMKMIMEEGETLQGSLDATLVGKINVFHQSSTTISTVLPFGEVATWQCGGRDFIWKVYTPQDGIAQGLLQQAVEKFRCE